MSVIVPLAAGGLALVLFVIRQLMVKQPLMNLRAFKHPMFLVGSLLIFVCMVTPVSTIAFIVMLHICLMIGVLLVWMPAQTNGMNQLPRHMHPDGTAIMNTLIQIAGAIGMAVAVSIMTSGANHYMKNMTGQAGSPFTPAALTAGIQDAFLFVLSVAVAGSIVGLFIKRVKAA